VIEQVGACGGDGWTEQVRVTVATPFPKPALTLEVDDPPGFTGLGVNGVAATQNWGGLVTSDAGENVDVSAAAPTPKAEL
jgi:hypothetical protein